MTSDANGVYRGVYTYGEERISVRDLVEVEGVPNNPLYYMYDGRGSVTQLTNAKGNVSDQYRYTPFGEPMSGGKLSPNTKLLNNPYGYNGEYHDLESGFQYLRARYYNPETARFITRDSYLGEINEPFSLNRYAYTANNPVMNVDPSGHISLDAGGGGGSSSSTYSTSTPSSSYTKTASSRPLLQKDSDNKEAVRTLQTMLKTLQYDIGKSGVDGIFGKDTDAAVRAFQRNNGLQVDGKVGINTWAKLEEIYNNVIGTGIIPDNVSQGSNGSGGSGSSFVNSKVVDAKGSSNNSKGCGIDAVSGAAKSADKTIDPEIARLVQKGKNGDYWREYEKQVRTPFSNDIFYNVATSEQYNQYIIKAHGENIKPVDFKTYVNTMGPEWEYLYNHRNRGDELAYAASVGIMIIAAFDALTIPLDYMMSQQLRGGTEAEIMANEIKFSDKFSKPAYKNQVAERGWTNESIADAINKPVKTAQSTNKYTGNSVTVYFKDSTHYVAVDNGTGKVIQVSNLNKSNWAFDPTFSK